MSRMIPVSKGLAKTSRSMPSPRLTRAEREILERLCVVEIPLDCATVARLSGESRAGVLDSLVRRGLLEASAGSLRLHDAARAAIRIAGPARVRARVARLLAGEDDAAAALESVRLHLAGRRLREAVSVLERRGAEILERGLAPRLWMCLQPVATPPLARWRLRCAVELGDGAALAEVREPRDPSLDDRLRWTRALQRRGMYVEALESAKALASVTDPAVAFEAGLLHAVGLANLGRPAQMCEVLRGLRPLRAEDRALRDAHLARGLGLAGEPAEALRTVAGLGPDFSLLPLRVRRIVRDRVATVLYDLGRLREARNTLRSEGVGSGPHALRLFDSRHAMLLDASLALEMGNLEECRDLLSRIAPFARRSVHEAWSRHLEVDLRLATGQLAEMDRLVDALIRSTTPGATLGLDLARAGRIRLDILRGEPSASLPTRDGDAAAPMYGHALELWTLRARVRAGERLWPDGMPGAQSFDDTEEHHALYRVVTGEAALIAGDAAAAERELRAAIDRTEESGYRVLGADAMQSLCAALLVLAGDAGLARVASDLCALGGAFPSPLVAGEGRFWAMATDAAPNPAGWEALAATGAPAPVAARRARALLGGPVRLDALDCVVVDAILRRTAPWRVEPVGRPPSRWRPGWGIDARRTEIWFPGGRRVSLSHRPLLWRILETMADAGGFARKEELALRAWSIRSYDSQRDDRRLQSALRRLRRIIEDDPLISARLVAQEGGCAFGDGEPVRRLRAVG